MELIGYVLAIVLIHVIVHWCDILVTTTIVIFQLKLRWLKRFLWGKSFSFSKE